VIDMTVPMMMMKVVVGRIFSVAKLTLSWARPPPPALRV
jgi:hypothetical protein